jgi:diguanylate cyclase (GGDEF)-like protein
MLMLAKEKTDIKLQEAQHSLEDSNRKLAALNRTDGLTGIANRRHFDEMLDREYVRHARSVSELSLILLDIDHFKAFNDSYGHVQGDECLRRIGRVLADSATRAVDLVARYGGEEFACILPGTGPAGAAVIAEQIRRAIQDLAIPHKGSVTADCVTASLGAVTVRCTPDRSATDLLVQAGDLLYLAKSSGRNRVVALAPTDPAGAPRRLKA